ncbi:hypothetical protein COX86_03370 [Candidatus Micrarchaeota archaeon CG_4_10_14_0_2_um_filter_60_11]|nr:MAG: hypothetical protein AUJ16_02965 [Candidatus Micrarchaeota archaeon CG1_02_60_51]PIN96223.1 MAG: hypothetical protein COU39_02200 [Candidatus Micrarchaeota archaeon CG10_big_fil_rev_8_21_14_0_10_60_32]PIO01669.1 MAG: hypothetical protein COT58_03960 [Candidatus Micrarchaeota archaeon CG09_land_8_20_14_0_10_60_16]PIY91214.1 MAG: hypothetical protein COY71_04360 [Candidatus Micrarchaeota archaeon CG_4_10_14_0_8_um_filter_60_7]PIZ90742.1 MAG: hypothetical protein COX86_03370 [Candidatus Mi
MKGGNSIGPWAFIIGIVIAILAGFMGMQTSLIVLALAVLGLVVGFLNVSEKETMPFLVATIAFMMAASSLVVVFAAVGMAGIETVIMQNIGTFVAPAAAVVAIKALYDITKDR